VLRFDDAVDSEDPQSDTATGFSAVFPMASPFIGIASRVCKRSGSDAWEAFMRVLGALEELRVLRKDFFDFGISLHTVLEDRTFLYVSSPSTESGEAEISQEIT